MHAYGIKIYNEINLFKSHVKIEIIFIKLFIKKIYSKSANTTKKT